MKKFSFITIAIFAIAILVCVSLGSLISSLLVQMFALTETVASQKQTVYAISIGTSQTEEDLLQSSHNLQAKDNAGFLFQLNGTYHNLASIHQNKNDAEKVKSSLSQNGIEGEILTIEIPAIRFDIDLDTSEKEVLSAALNANFETYKKLYDVAVRLETNVSSKSDIKTECNKIFANYVSIRANFDALFNTLPTLQKSMQETEEILSLLLSETYVQQNQTYCSLVKLTYCKVLLQGI